MVPGVIISGLGSSVRYSDFDWLRKRSSVKGFLKYYTVGKRGIFQYEDRELYDLNNRSNFLHFWFCNFETPVSSCCRTPGCRPGARQTVHRDLGSGNLLEVPLDRGSE